MKISWLISWCVWIRSSLFGLKWLPKEKLKTEEQTDHGTSSFVENEFYIIWFSRFQDSIKIQVSATMLAKNSETSTHRIYVYASTAPPVAFLGFIFSPLEAWWRHLYFMAHKLWGRIVSFEIIIPYRFKKWLNYFSKW